MAEVQCAAAVQGGGGAEEVEGRETGAGACVRVIALMLPWMKINTAAGDFRHGQGRRSLLRREHDWEHRLGLLVEGLGTCQ